MGIVAALLLGQISISSTLNLTVDTTKGIHPISPYIYGTNPADWSGRWKVATFTRIGGNRLTAYNWVNNASNAGSDYYFENDAYLGGGDTPLGAFMPSINAALLHNAPMLMTLQLAGHVSADKAPPGDVRNTPGYLTKRFDQSFADSPPGTNIYGPPDLSTHTVYEDQMVAHVLSGRVKNSVPVWWEMDNEPDIWNSTHAEIVLNPETYADLVQRNADYATMVKRVDPTSLVFGPVNYGWEGYVSLQNAPDANGRYWIDYYLGQMNQASTAAGKRLLDVLDLHYYSEATGGGVRVLNSGTDPALVAARVQAPRSLYDPHYVETSWITQYSTYGPIKLFPRMMSSIASQFPGTKLAITEYNFGGEDISGGIAQADTLGAFGNSGVFAAAFWPVQNDVEFEQGAFELYRNYDGNGHTFGDTSVQATTPAIDRVSIWASTDTARPGHVIAVVINRSMANQPVFLRVLGTTVHSGLLYKLSAASSSVVPAGSVKVGRGATINLSPMSAYAIDLS